MGPRDRDCWIYDFSMVLKPDAIRRMRGNPGFEGFTGSRFSAYPGLVLITAIAGAFGGTLVSGALWRQFWLVPLWLAAMAAFTWIVIRLSKPWQPPIRFLSGWCLFFGVVTAMFAMWGAQLDSSAWAYGIAGGLLFFLVGITGGLIEPPNARRMEDWFLTSAIMAPIGGCMAAWLYRNHLQPDLTSAALAGMIASVPFLAVTMALHLAAWRPGRGQRKLAVLLLHNDAFVEDAIPLLDAAIQQEPEDRELTGLRALAKSLAGRNEEAEAEWDALRSADPGTTLPDIGQGWTALRRGDPAKAAVHFTAAMSKGRRDPWPLQGLGIARLRLGDATGALDALRGIRMRDHDARSLTYLAQAWLAAADLPNAIEIATAAIEELDSIHGQSWLVRGDAYRARGAIDSADEDYNRALLADDEEGISERALAALEAIDRPVREEDGEW